MQLLGQRIGTIRIVIDTELPSIQGVAIYLLAVVCQAKCISDFVFAILIGENLTQSHFFLLS